LSKEIIKFNLMNLGNPELLENVETMNGIGDLFVF
jgi:hypothetical protein